jgi:hypothetical protein
VDGSTAAASTISFSQFAQGGAAGSTNGGTGPAGNGGDATNSIARSKNVSSFILSGTSDGGKGGDRNDGSGAAGKGGAALLVIDSENSGGTTTARASDVTGGNGGVGSNAASGGDGGSATSSMTAGTTGNSHNASATGSQAVKGGNAGPGAGSGNGGRGGDATSISIASVSGTSSTPSATDIATGGVGGSSSGAGAAGAGGDASSTASVSAPNSSFSLSPTATATGGAAGTPSLGTSLGGHGGNATALVTATGLGSASATANATGGNGTNGQPNGNSVASAISNGNGGTASTTAKSAGKYISAIVASAIAPSAGLVEAQSRAAYDLPTPPLSTAAGFEATSYVTGAPLNFASLLTGNPNSQTAFTNARPMVAGTLGGVYSSNASLGSRTFSSSATFSLVVSSFAGTEAVRFAVLDAQGVGSGFTSMSITITSRGSTVDTQTFTDAATATTYLKDRVYSFGVASGTNGLIPVTVQLIVTTSTPDSGYVLNYGAAVADGSSPTGFSAWAATNSVPADFSDADNDGLNNFLEYALGRNPNATETTSASTAGTQNISGSNYPTLTVSRNGILSDVNYTVQVSTDLIHWNSGPAFTTTITNTATQLVVRSNTPLSPSSPPQFLRLVCTPQ